MAAKGHGIHTRSGVPPTGPVAPGPDSIDGPTDRSAEEHAVPSSEPALFVELRYLCFGMAVYPRRTSRPVVEELLAIPELPGGFAFRAQDRERAGHRIPGIASLPEPGVTERLRSHLLHRLPPYRGPAPSPGVR